MKDTKPKPSKSKFALREPAKPLQTPETPLRDDHPMALIVAQSKAPTAAATPDIKSSLAITSSPDTAAPEPLQIAPVDLKSSPDIMSPPDIKTGEWTAYPNEISDRIKRTLELSDQSILERLYRLTRGHHRDTVTVSAQTLAEACNVTARQVPRSTTRLAARGLIEIMGVDLNNPNKLKRGTIYRMLLPPADLKSRADIKSKGDFSAEKKERSKGNIKSSGLAPDSKNCPDCSGTGFWYPQGEGNGVAKCAHPKLKGI